MSGVLILTGTWGLTWVDETWQRRVSLLDRADRVSVNERMARKRVAMPVISPLGYESWSGHADPFARIQRHCERSRQPG